MLTYKGGQRVGKGTYWDMMNGQRVDIQQEGVLPGTARYIRSASALILVAGPFLGLVYAIFLPFIAIAMAVTLVTKKVVGGAARLAARSASFGWRPIEAYLSGKKKEKEKKS